MKSLFKPRLPIEAYTGWENLSTEDFREKSTLDRSVTAGGFSMMMPKL
jgi:hypothetical protein